jgi:hypothetical protein
VGCFDSTPIRRRAKSCSCRTSCSSVRARRDLPQIFVDGRTLPVDPEPTWNGYSVGRWQGDTLVVQTTGCARAPGSIATAARSRPPLRSPSGSGARTSVICRSRSPWTIQGVRAAVDGDAHAGSRGGHGAARLPLQPTTRNRGSAQTDSPLAGEQVSRWAGARQEGPCPPTCLPAYPPWPPGDVSRRVGIVRRPAAAA